MCTHVHTHVHTYPYTHTHIPAPFPCRPVDTDPLLLDTATVFVFSRTYILDSDLISVFNLSDSFSFLFPFFYWLWVYLACLF